MRNGEKGFTLIELIIAAGITALVAGAAGKEPKSLEPSMKLMRDVHSVKVVVRYFPGR